VTELADLTEVPRALPPLDDVHRPFWTGGSDGRLLILRCEGCGRWVHPPVATCPACGGALRAEPVSGRATVFTYTVNHHPFNPAVPVPYVVAIVELEEQAGLRVVTNLVHCDVEDLAIGMPVRVAFEAHGDVFVPVFEPDPVPH
jgi:uncharacterized OB-fold protein